MVDAFDLDGPGAAAGYSNDLGSGVDAFREGRRDVLMGWARLLVRVPLLVDLVHRSAVADLSHEERHMGDVASGATALIEEAVHVLEDRAQLVLHFALDKLPGRRDDGHQVGRDDQGADAGA